jgi:hypothetical protein
MATLHDNGERVKRFRELAAPQFLNGPRVFGRGQPAGG